MAKLNPKSRGKPQKESAGLGQDRRSDYYRGLWSYLRKMRPGEAVAFAVEGSTSALCTAIWRWQRNHAPDRDYATRNPRGSDHLVVVRIDSMDHVPLVEILAEGKAEAFAAQL
jgi:hypothetical protein